MFCVLLLEMYNYVFEGGKDGRILDAHGDFIYSRLLFAGSF